MRHGIQVTLTLMTTYSLTLSITKSSIKFIMILLEKRQSAIFSKIDDTREHRVIHSYHNIHTNNDNIDIRLEYLEHINSSLTLIILLMVGR